MTLVVPVEQDGPGRTARRITQRLRGGLGAARRASRASKRDGSGRPRIAFVTPWPPEPSGVADYAIRLVVELGKTVDVDVVTGNSELQYTDPQARGVRLLRASDADLCAALGSYDRVVYAMGNSRFHMHVPELMRARPDAVVFHDVQLTGFYTLLSAAERPEDVQGALHEHFRAMYGSPPPADAIADGTLQWPLLQALGICMTPAIQKLAGECFVHSASSLQMLLGDRPSAAVDVPVRILPFGMPDVDSEARPRGATSLEPVVISLGVVTANKGVAQIIDAFARVAIEYPTARLVVAGPIEDADPLRWHTYAEQHAPGVAIELPGYLPAERFAALLREADVAVQLRLVSTGEASGVTADCLAAGLPTLVSDLGWAGELPSDAVLRVSVEADAAMIAEGITALLSDRRLRAKLSAAALEHASAHSFARLADAYREALGLA
jgi:glycosyltransferase involved in cell wall biosynthesis